MLLLNLTKHQTLITEQQNHTSEQRMNLRTSKALFSFQTPLCAFMLSHKRVARGHPT